MTLSLIVAMSENGVIGRRGDLPWRLSADLRRFKRLTMGHTIVMGRKTYESIGRLLPGRTSVVVTRQENYDAGGAVVANDLDAAIRLSSDDSEIFIIGGAEIYRTAIEQVDRVYLTCVHADVDGDTFFPVCDWTQWSLVEESRHATDEQNEFEHSFQIYERINADARQHQ